VYKIQIHSALFDFAQNIDNFMAIVNMVRMRWVGHVAHMGERKGVYGVLVGNLRERDHLDDPGLEGRIILRRTFRKWDVGVWTGSS
jgi:hypothetical protein